MIKIVIEPISIEDAMQFVIDEVAQTPEVANSKKGATAIIDFFFVCLENSIITNPEKWNGLQIEDFKDVYTLADDLKSRPIEEKVSRATIETQSENITIDGMQINPVSIKLESQAEFIHLLGQNPKPHFKRKKLTVEWNEPCDDRER